MSRINPYIYLSKITAESENSKPRLTTIIRNAEDSKNMMAIERIHYVNTLVNESVDNSDIVSGNVALNEINLKLVLLYNTYDEIMGEDVTDDMAPIKRIIKNCIENVDDYNIRNEMKLKDFIIKQSANYHMIKGSSSIFFAPDSIFWKGLIVVANSMNRSDLVDMIVSERDKYGLKRQGFFSFEELLDTSRLFHISELPPKPFEESVDDGLTLENLRSSDTISRPVGNHSVVLGEKFDSMEYQALYETARSIDEHAVSCSFSDMDIVEEKVSFSVEGYSDHLASAKVNGAKFFRVLEDDSSTRTVLEYYGSPYLLFSYENGGNLYGINIKDRSSLLRIEKPDDKYTLSMEGVII